MMNADVSTLALRSYQQGVELMGDGRHPDAIRAFSRSLAIVKQELDPNEEASCSSKSCGEGTPSTILHFYCQGREPEEKVKLLLSDAGDHQESNSLTIFECPISVLRSQPTSLTLSDCTRLTRFTLYNLGLAFQLYATDLDEEEEKQSGCAPSSSLNKRSKYLQKASRFYQLAYDMMVAESMAMEGAELLTTMAILNNLGIVQEVLGETEGSKHTFQTLLLVAMAAVGMGDPQVMKHTELFFGNIQARVLYDALKTASAA